MNTQIVCLFVAFAGNPDFEQTPTIYSPSRQFAAAIRGQSPSDLNYEEDTTANGQYVMPPQSTYPMPPVAPGAPFAFPQVAPSPGMPAPYAGGYSYGANGPQPYRLGKSGRIEVGYIPSVSASGGRGNLGVLEVDTELRHTTPMANGWVFGLAPQFNYRAWDGPSLPGLPGSVYRFGGDVELSTPANGPWSMKLVFSPSINTDFDNSISGDAWIFDGHGILFYRYSPQWLFAFGAGFWDRVKDRVVPYAGVVFTPNDIWEFRLLFPESRISLFLGNPWGVGHWVYVSGEYNIEAYEIQEQLAQIREQIELEDWRILLGLRADSGVVSRFIEAGWVLGRDVRFRNATAGFDITSGFILRGGIRF